MNPLRFLRQRIRFYWQVFLALAFGVILATALLATGPVLVEAVIEFGLRRVLINADPLAANVRLFNSASPSNVGYQSVNDGVIRFAQSQFAPHVERIIPSGGTRYIHPWVESQLLTDQRVNLRFYGENDASLLENVEFVAGSWPKLAHREEGVAAVAVSEPMAHSYGLEVGDRLPMSIRQNGVEPELWLEVAGIIKPIDSREDFWFGNRSPLKAQSDARYAAQFSALVPYERFFDLADLWFSPSEVNYEWFVLLTPRGLTIDELPTLLARLANLEEGGWTIGDSNVRIETRLASTLSDFESLSRAVQAPLLALTSTVVLVALYYVVMAAALSLQQVEGEFAVLRGRGASGWQLFRLQLLEGGFIGLAAVVSGPGLAWCFVSALSVWGPLADVRQAEWVLRLPSAAWLAAFIGGSVALAGMLVPLPGLLRRSIVAHRQFQSRANRRPWWQQVYLDVFILVGGLVLVWRLHTTGSIVGGSWEQPRVDWLLLLAPLALLLGAATILLRLFPFVLDLGARLASMGRGLPAALALWQAARNPSHFARMVLLLTLAMALGLFSTGLNTALDLNELDRARYASGGDIRLANPGLNSEADLAEVSGVRQTAAAWRSEGSLTTRIGSVNPRFDLLAIDPEPFSDTVVFRPDFAEQPVTALLDKLRFSPETLSPTLPGIPDRLGLWLLLPPDIIESYRFKLTVRSDLVAFFSVPLSWSIVDDEGPLPVTNSGLPNSMDADFNMEGRWYYFDGPLPKLSEKHSPISLQTIWIQWRGNQFWSASPIGVDDLTAVDKDGNRVIVDSFEAGLNWLSATETMTTSIESATPHTGSGLLVLNVSSSGLRPNRWHGVSQLKTVADRPLPALASEGFLDTAQLKVGDPVSTWVDSAPTSFEVVGVVTHFPSMYEEQDAGFLVTSRKLLLAHLNEIRDTPTTSNEIFIAAAPGVAEETLSTALPELFARETQFWETETIRNAIRSDPLALGLRSVTLFAFVLTAVLSLVAFGIYTHMGARQRGPMYGVLRAIGLSRRNLYFALAWEQIILILSGLTLGTVLGLLLNRLTLPGLPISLGGRPPVPPFLVRTDWLTVGTIYLTLGLAFLALLGITVGMLWRSKLHRILRVGEE